MKLRKVLLGLLFFLLIVLAGLCFLEISYPEVFRHSGKPEGRIQNPDSGQARMTAVEYVKVKEVVDGDTIKLESGETVRYLGVNTPEIYELENKEDQEKKEIKWIKVNKCYSQEAMRKNQELVEGKVVRLEKETSDRDKFGRLLRDVWINPSTSSGQVIFINLELVKEGDAKAMTVPPDVKYRQQILAAEKEAREGKRGLWEKCF